MSSRLLGSDDPRPIAPILWPSVATAPKPDTPREAAAEPPVDVAELERAWTARVAEARAAGMREGEAAGRARAAAEAQPVLERMARTIDELAGLRPRLRREAEADLVKLAIAIARRVIRRELAVDPDALHGLVRAALEKLQGQELSRVRVHASQVSAISALLRERPGGAAIEVAADPSGDPGAAVFETSRGNLDASVDSQLNEIERGLADTLRRQA
jgi:flagellar assembly protein FliH